MTDEEIKIQIALGSFPEKEFTLQFIQDCKDLEIFKLLIKWWVHKTYSYRDGNNNDKITNTFLNHPLIYQELKDYLLVGRIYQKSLWVRPSSHLIDPVNIKRMNDKILELEEKIFGN
jgi:hypothetical protein